jgi:hypothetical protein
MPRKIENRRSVRRQDIPDAVEATVEFLMSDGVRRRVPLVNISLNDLCFENPTKAPAIQSGIHLTDVVVRVGKFSFECNLAVQRTWRQFQRGVQCGARLYPKTESDQNELVSLMASFRSKETEQTAEDSTA